jgi:ABC-type multidrug transport system fused ATPase/permease subunit
MPLFAIIFSSILTALGSDKANFWAGMFAVLAVAAFVSNFLQIALFRYSGEKLTRRLRNLSFRAILRQEIGFFDQDENSTGALTTRNFIILTIGLAEDASLVQGLSGQTFGAIVQAAASMVAGFAISFYYCWQLSLVIIGTIPLIGISGYFQLRSLTGYGQAAKSAYEEAATVACEAIENIRTVATLTQEDYFIQRYELATNKPHKTALKGAWVSSFGYGFSQGILFWSWAVAFFYGSKLIVWGLYIPGDILNAMFAIIFTGNILYIYFSHLRGSNFKLYA